MSDQKNLHQQKKEAVKLLNYRWHNPKVSDDQRAKALELLEEILQFLNDD